MPAPMGLCPRFDYPGGAGGATISLLFTFAQRPWEPDSTGTGGHRVSSAGVPASRQFHRDRGVSGTLRFYEYEWPQVDDFFSWWQANMNQAATMWIDQDVPATQYSVYLVAPAIGTPIRPRRNSFLGVFELDYQVRSVTGVRMVYTPWTPTLQVATGIVMSPETLNLRTGDLQQMRAQVYVNATEVYRPVVWRTSNAAIATVNGEGMVKAVGPGEVTIYADTQGAVGSLTDFLTTTVLERVNSVVLTPNPGTVATTLTLQITATPYDVHGNALSLNSRGTSWMSSDTAVASVDGNGLVTGHLPGSVTIQVLVDGILGSTVVTVT